MLVQRRRRWTNIKPTLVQRLVNTKQGRVVLEEIGIAQILICTFIENDPELCNPQLKVDTNKGCPNIRPIWVGKYNVSNLPFKRRYLSAQTRGSKLMNVQYN